MRYPICPVPRTYKIAFPLTSKRLWRNFLRDMAHSVVPKYGNTKVLTQYVGTVAPCVSTHAYAYPTWVNTNRRYVFLLKNFQRRAIILFTIQDPFLASFLYLTSPNPICSLRDRTDTYTYIFTVYNLASFHQCSTALRTINEYSDQWRNASWRVFPFLWTEFNSTENSLFLFCTAPNFMHEVIHHSKKDVAEDWR